MIALVLLECGATAAMGGTQSLWKDDYEKSITSRFVSKYRGTFGAFAISEFEDYSLKMDQLMIELECCGLQGSQDFSNTKSRWYQEGRKYSDGTTGDAIKIPPACCKYTSKDFWRKGMLFPLFQANSLSFKQYTLISMGICRDYYYYYYYYYY
ncbi:unnamed protein product [Schistosoma curassoni]|uniref:Tetraspanin-5 n=1 Tax=Schistosoma curassoni TaxID=6186 RepID=A0A183JMB2_9TREM|nr:unnamed protein product [Schistosoma curassoni]